MNPNEARGPVFDASAVLALMQGEPGSAKLMELQAEAVVNAANAAEVLAKLVSRGMPPGEAKAAYAALHLKTCAFDPDMATLSARYVRKGVSLGDRCFLAAAQSYGNGWTSDRELVARFGEQVSFVNYVRCAVQFKERSTS